MGSISVLEPSIKGDDKGKKNGESERVIKKTKRRHNKEKKKTKKTKRKKTKKKKKYRIQILSTFPEICSIFLEIWQFFRICSRTIQALRRLRPEQPCLDGCFRQCIKLVLSPEGSLQKQSPYGVHLIILCIKIDNVQKCVLTLSILNYRSNSEEGDEDRSTSK